KIVVPATPDTIFAIGSVTKTFAGLLAAREEELSNDPAFLDTSLSEHLNAEDGWSPEFLKYNKVRNVATHTSGLPSMPSQFMASFMRASVVDRFSSTMFSVRKAFRRIIKNVEQEQEVDVEGGDEAPVTPEHKDKEHQHLEEHDVGPENSDPDAIVSWVGIEEIKVMTHEAWPVPKTQQLEPAEEKMCEAPEEDRKATAAGEEPAVEKAGTEMRNVASTVISLNGEGATNDEKEREQAEKEKEQAAEAAKKQIWSYSNAGTAILCEILRKREEERTMKQTSEHDASNSAAASGQEPQEREQEPPQKKSSLAYSDLVKGVIFEPLGMSCSGLYVKEQEQALKEQLEDKQIADGVQDMG
ncbi:unnamed protein product, partial [Amoebophrya sp. A25]